MKELWQVMEESFVKTGNIKYDRNVFFSSKQQKEDIERAYMGDSLNKRRIVA